MNGVSENPGNTCDEIDKCVSELKEMMLSDDKLSNLHSEENYLLRYLNSTNFDVLKAYQKLKDFYELLEEYPEWFTTSCPLEKKSMVNRDIRVIPGGCDKDGRIIYIVKIGNIDASTMDLLEDLIPVDEFWAELFLLDPYSVITTKGVCIIFDIANFSWKMMKWATPHNIKMAVLRVQCLPIKEFRYHVVNDSFLVHSAISFVWMFIPQHIKELVKFHFSDYESLYQCIDPKELPLEYGGNKTVKYTEFNRRIYERSDDISRNFKLYRESYLKNISQNKILNQFFLVFIPILFKSEVTKGNKD